MKKFKSITLIVLFSLVLICVALAGCDLTGQQHQHSYSDTYKRNNSYHWQVCEICGQASAFEDHAFSEWNKDVDCHWKDCEVCGYTTGKVAHELGQWVVDVEPTETKAGSKHATCECGYEVSDSIPPTDENHQHSFPDTYVKVDSAQHYQECSSCGYKLKSNHEMSDWVTDVEPTETSAGHKYRECVQECGYIEEKTIPQLGVQATGTVELYAINDFHGEYAKLAQISGYLAGRLEEDNTVAINSGDMFQGSMESNSNYGKLFSQCMDIAGFDSFTYGNHEFDWGLDNLRSLAANSTTPFLGANIYNWNANTKTWGNFADDLAQEYVIKDLGNGLRVGIIGVIGKDQITSISSQLVQTIGFKNPADIVPNLSNKLRNELGCDVIVISAHTGQSTFLDDSSWDITDYADVVFCAHTHYAETGYKNGVPFIQGGAYGRYVSHVELYVDGNGNVRCDGYSNIQFDDLDTVNSYVKDRVQMEIDNSNSRIADEANEKLATLTGGYLNSATAVPRMVANAIANYAVSQDYQIDLVMVNNARNYLSSGSITYTQLYEAIPFDNVVYIAKVTGYDIHYEAKYDSNSIWRVSGNAIEKSSTKYYTIAVLDYLLYHQDSNREYNYFPSAFTSGFTPVALTKDGVDMYNYRHITRDFLRKVKTVNATTYTEDNNYTDKSLLTQSVDLSSSGGTTDPTQPTHQGTLSDPYSVADALLLASQYTASSGSASGYVTGIVSGMSSARLGSNTDDIGNFYLTDGNGNTILVYYLSKFNGASQGNNWSGLSDLSDGDVVVIYAKSLYTYVGSSYSTPEVGSGYAITINGNSTI